MQLPRAIDDEDLEDLNRDLHRGARVLSESLLTFFSDRGHAFRQRDRFPVTNTGVVSREFMRDLLDQAKREIDGERWALEEARSEAEQFVQRARVEARRIGRHGLTQAIERLRRVLRAVDPATNAILAYDPSSEFYVYALVDPREPERVRYVGRTKNPSSRYRSHVLRGSPAMRAWVAELQADGVWPTMICLERCRDELVDDRERSWIARHVRSGQADLNQQTYDEPEELTL